MPLLYDQKNLQPFSQLELDAVIRKHTMFAKGRVGGARAILTAKNLSGLNFRKAILDGADFSGSMLHDADVREAHLDGAMFFTASLQRIEASHASFVRADMRGTSLVGAIFTGADLTSADLREGAMAKKDRRGNLNLLVQPEDTESRSREGSFTEGVDAREAIFTGARLHKAFMRGINLQDSFLERADFSLAQMDGASLQRAVLVDTRFDGVELKGVDMHGALRNELSGLALQDAFAPLAVLLAQHRTWVESHGAQGRRLDFTRYDLVPRGEEKLDFRDATLSMMKARQGVFMGLRFSGAELQASEWQDCDLRKTAFDRTDGRGADFSGSNLMRATFQLAEMYPLKLPSGGLLRTRFKGCNLRYADFTACDLTEADFSGADLSYADVRGARLEGVNFSGATLDGVLCDSPLRI